MFGIDVHPVYQKDINFNGVANQGYEAVFVKASEGDRFVPAGLSTFVNRASDKGFVLGYYHFLTKTDGDRQARHFVETVDALGGPENRVLIADFESYGNNSPSYKDLSKFVAGVKRSYPGKKVMLYAGWGYWTSAVPASLQDANLYDVDALWDARYADRNRHDDPKAYWDEIAPWYWSTPKWGGQTVPLYATQFTSQGLVGGLYVDVNKFHTPTIDELKELAA